MLLVALKHSIPLARTLHAGRLLYKHARFRVGGKSFSRGTKRLMSWRSHLSKLTIIVPVSEKPFLLMEPPNCIPAVQVL